MIQKRNITVTLEKAKEWYKSDNVALRKIALQAFSEEELKPFDFTKVKTFEDALRALNYSRWDMQKIEYNIKSIYCYNSKASATILKLNIIRRALNQGYDLHLTKNADGQSYTWYPYFRFITKSSTYYDEELKSNKLKKLGEITSESVVYNVLGGSAVVDGATAGLARFNSYNGVSFINASVGFLGCATKEIAEHMGKYFGMCIVEAMYSDMVDFKVIEK